MKNILNLKKKLFQIIYEVIDETNAGRPPGCQLEKSPEEVIFGRNGKLDSLGLVHSIVAVEDPLRDELVTSITLADEPSTWQNSAYERPITAVLRICRPLFL